MGDTAIEALHSGGPSNGPPSLLILKPLVSEWTIAPDDCAVVLLRPKANAFWQNETNWQGRAGRIDLPREVWAWAPTCECLPERTMPCVLRPPLHPHSDIR